MEIDCQSQTFDDKGAEMSQDQLTDNSFNLADDRKLKAGDAYLTTRDIEKRYRISPPTQCRWRREGGGPPFVKLKGTILYPESLFDAWMQSKLVGSTSELHQLSDDCTDRYKHLPAARAKADEARAGKNLQC